MIIDSCNFILYFFCNFLVDVSKQAAAYIVVEKNYSPAFFAST